ncbi:MAG: prenyltransferase/squalene oxidase repeat-containing protein [Planctomycetaceae bacterium]|nr:terpene cyclase/mutase family protein [Planctomycetaceae bacterium]
MTIRDELQAALRRGCTALDSSGMEAVKRFLPLFSTVDGGFGGSNSAGQTSSDLYYTMFGYQCLEALDLHLYFGLHSPGGHRLCLEEYCKTNLDLTHLACLARCWISLAAMEHSQMPPGLADDILKRIESYRSADGGYAQTPASREGSAYDAFLAMGAYQDLRRPLPQSDQLAQALEQLATAEGGFTNSSLIPIANVPATAAAMIVLRHLGRPAERRHVEWLIRQCRIEGDFGHRGFVAWEGAPQPDLLSTAVALHALKSANASLADVRQVCREFVYIACRHESGAFRSTWGDDAMVDVEYLYYGLLACGCLAR